MVLRFFTFAAITALTCVYLVNPVYAFWNIWRQNEAPINNKVPIVWKTVRESTCGSSDAVSIFGENAFMRREAARKTLSNDVAQSIASAYLAETTNHARELLLPLMQSTNVIDRSVARISLAFVLFRRHGLRGPHLSEIKALLDKPMSPTIEADRHYLRAVLALAHGEWTMVASEAKNALTRAPKYYNAHVLNSLAELELLGTRNITAYGCNKVIDRIEKVLLPLLHFGACPTHVAHFDLAAERYLTKSVSGGTTERLRLIRRIYLAYVAKNDPLGRLLVESYRETYGRDTCFQRIDLLDFSL